jgi:hypothetical protein
MRPQRVTASLLTCGKAQVVQEAKEKRYRCSLRKNIYTSRLILLGIEPRAAADPLHRSLPQVLGHKHLQHFQGVPRRVKP